MDVVAKKTPAIRATYKRMEDGTAEEYGMIMSNHRVFSSQLPDRLITYLETLRSSYEGEPIDRYEHSLQTATRALRDNADDEMVVAALLHDVGDLLSPENHGEYAASVLRPYVRNETYWMLKHHPTFQGYFYFHHIGLNRDERDRYIGHPCFEMTANFCERWDQVSFDPEYDRLPMSAFEPIMRRVFARVPWSLHNPDLGY